MNKREAIRLHKERLANLTNTEAMNLMVHAANKTPLLAVDEFSHSFVSIEGLC